MIDTSLRDLKRYGQACEAYRQASPSENLAVFLVQCGNAIANEHLARDCYDLAYLTRESLTMKTLHSGEVETTSLEANRDALGHIPSE